MAASGYLVFHSQQQISARHAWLRAFESSERAAALALADLRAAEQAYVAAGQGVAFWMPKVTSLLETAERDVDSLRTLSGSTDARAALMQAAASIAEFKNVDQRARDYLSANQPLMAADVVFTDGGETAAAAARQVETANAAEHQDFDRFEAVQKRTELYAVGGAAGVVVLTLLLLVGSGAAAEADESESITLSGRTDRLPSAPGPSAAAPESAAPLRESVPILQTAAALCTDFGRARDMADLKELLARAADALDATGLVVWLGSPSGGNLRPVLAHGYPQQLLDRMPSIPRAADNAAAAAYRTGALQIVLARPGASSGALVAPLLSCDGCIGSLTAEINGGTESSDAAQALAVIFAAQLAGVLAASAGAESADAPPRAASL